MTEAVAAPEYRALDILVGPAAPRVGGREPYWRPEPAAPHDRVRVPAWRWGRPMVDRDGDRVAVLDSNAAYLSAITSVDVAHGALMHDGPQRFDRSRPGYWLLEVAPWTAHSLIMSPLGTATLPDGVWLTTPTVALLEDLTEQGHWPGVEVLDSWTAGKQCRLRAWGERIRDARTVAMRSGDAARVAAVKHGYSVAVTLLGQDGVSRAYRPDWAQHIRAQHAATMWRRAWATVQAGDGPIAAGSVDELAYGREAVRRWWQAGRVSGLNGAARPPLTIDVTGAQLGTFKVKHVVSRQAWQATHV